MARKRTHDEMHEIMFETYPLRFNTATSLKRQCITDVGTMKKEHLYTDEQRRIYRPRIEITEEKNSRECREDVPEAFIAFDVYLLKKKMITGPRMGVLQIEKGSAPFIGERITLSVRSRRANDQETVTEVDVEVTDVSWGSFLKEIDEGVIREYPNENLGYIMTQVKGSYSRSLCMPQAFIKKRNPYPIGR